jgi:hypothetical protein
VANKNKTVRKEEEFIPSLLLFKKRIGREKEKPGNNPGWYPNVGIYESLMWDFKIYFYYNKNEAENQEN